GRLTACQCPPIGMKSHVFLPTLSGWLSPAMMMTRYGFTISLGTPSAGLLLEGTAARQPGPPMESDWRLPQTGPAPRLSFGSLRTAVAERSYLLRLSTSQ